MTQQLRLTIAAAAAVLLSASCLLPIFTSGGWVVPSAAAVGAVAVAAAGARALALPRWLVPVAGTAGLVVMLTVWFAGKDAWLVLVPTTGSTTALRDLAAEGFLKVETYAAPVPAERPLVLLTAAGLGLLALVVDHIAVTVRRPAMSGWALASVYTIPSGIDVQGVGWAAFCAGAAGWLTLLVVDHRDRVSRWGRSVGGTTRGAYESSRPLPALGRRIGVAGLAAAVAVPALLPGLTTGLIGGRGPGGGSGSGRGTTVDVSNPLIDLGRDLNRPTDREVLRYTTADDTPSYLRLVVLDEFTGRTWAPTELKVPDGQTVQSGFADPPGLGRGIATTPVRTSVRVLDLRTRWLPLPYPAQRVTQIRGRWLWDESTFNVFSTNTTTQRLDYEVDSLDVGPTPAQLRASATELDGLQRYLRLPQDLPEAISAAALERTRGADTGYDRAMALQEWLRDPSVFSYDERAPDGNGFDALEEFLRVRRGFCVHYASAMAVMARVLGIPARVAVGFTPGQRDTGDTWSVGTHDAHAWPELYFPGVGWVAFEPTPAQRTGLAPVWARADQDAQGGPAPATPGASPVPTPGTSAGGPDRPERDPGILGQQGAGGDGGSGSAVPWLAVGLGLGAVWVGVLPLLARAGLRRWRRRRGRGPAGVVAAWDELLDVATDHGLDVAVSATPRSLVAGIAEQGRLPEVPRAALARLARAVERLLYAREVGDVGDPWADVSVVTAALRAGSARGRRLRVLLLPASVIERGRRAARSAASGAASSSQRVRSTRTALTAHLLRRRPT